MKLGKEMRGNLVKKFECYETDKTKLTKVAEHEQRTSLTTFTTFTKGMYLRGYQTPKGNNCKNLLDVSFMYQ